MFPRLRQVLLLVLCGGVLAALLGELNHTLAPWGLGVSAPGLFIVFAALRLPPGPGLAASLLTGLWLDASAPEALFGRQAFLLGLACCLVFRVRDRLPRESTTTALATAALVNLACFVVSAFAGLATLPDPAAGAVRLLADLLLGQLFTFGVCAWHVAFQQAVLRLGGAAPAPLERRLA